MKYEIVVTEKYRVVEEHRTYANSKSEPKEAKVEDDIVKGEFNVTGRGNAYWLYYCVCEYVKKHFYNVGWFEIVLRRTHRLKGQKVIRVIDSCVCKGGLTPEEWGHQVDGFINREVVDDKGLFHNVSTEEDEDDLFTENTTEE